MEMVTVETVKAAVKQYEIKLFALRRCGICNESVHYVIHGDEVFFDPSCGCDGGGNGFELRSWSNLVEVFNRQTSEIREVLWNRFITKSAPGPRE